MSAETLRRAATRIRHDVEFGQAHGDPDFLLAVADWLDEAADFLAAYPGETQAMDNPLAVARAYLGES